MAGYAGCVLNSRLKLPQLACQQPCWSDVQFGSEYLLDLGFVAVGITRWFRSAALGELGTE